MTVQLALKNSPSARGAVLGEVSVSEVVLDKARELALAHFQEAEAQDFCGDAVDDQAIPSWVPSLPDWFPEDAVKALGYTRNEDRKPSLLTTVGVDAHEDHINGLVLIWVLHNDGMTFKQGRQSHKTLPGQWFIFNDRIAHAVKEAKKSTSYVCVAVPLKEREAP